MSPKFLACLTGCHSQLQRKMKQDRLAGAGENPDFGCRDVEFKLPLNHVKRTEYAAVHRVQSLEA